MEEVSLLRWVVAPSRHVGRGRVLFDVNVSVYRDGEVPMSGTRCEIKNLNSVKSVMIATSMSEYVLLSQFAYEAFV